MNSTQRLVLQVIMIVTTVISMRLKIIAHRSLGNCPPAGEERSERQLDDEDQLDPSESRVL